jgi:outer membrane protein OmpA-like peptidoglycan-associated protein
MSPPRKLLIALLALGACVSSEPAARRPAPEPAPPAAATAVPAPQPEAEADPAVEESRRSEEEIEQVELPPPDGTPAGGVVEVLFEAGATALTADALAILDRMSAGLPEGDAGYYLEVQGHTDLSGTEAGNLRIAEQRAEAVRRYLHREKRVPLDNIGIVPLGSSAPAADNRTPDGRERNRRAVVVVLLPP